MLEVGLRCVIAMESRNAVVVMSQNVVFVKA